MLSTPTQDLLDQLVEEFAPDPVVIAFDSKYQLPVQEASISTSSWPGYPVGPQNTRQGSTVSIAIPFSGNSQYLGARPSPRPGFVVPFGAIEGNEIILTITEANPTPERVKAYLDEQLALIRQFGDSLNNNLSSFRATLRSHLGQVIEERKSRLLRDRQLEGALGFPVRRRDDAPRPIPVVRRNLAVQRAEAQSANRVSRYADEFMLEDREYQDIIGTILGMARAFERTPSTFSRLKEEALRDFLLVILNGTYQGQATGETFNGNGRTDILVRAENRNVFISECKIWYGPAKFSDAIDQLLGYLVWRDTKAALILFVKRGNATQIVETADSLLRNHENFKRAGDSTSDPFIRRNYVMHQTGDTAREIQLALLLVVLRPVDSV